MEPMSSILAIISLITLGAYFVLKYDYWKQANPRQETILNVLQNTNLAVCFLWCIVNLPHSG